jgi:hypothetical protein
VLISSPEAWPAGPLSFPGEVSAPDRYEGKVFVPPFFSIIDTEEGADSHTVKFTLKHHSMALLPVMAANRVGSLPVSPASYQRWGMQDVRSHPVRTRPFELTEKVRALLKETGFDETNRLRYNIMTHGAEPVLAMFATIMKTQLPSSAPKRR